MAHPNEQNGPTAQGQDDAALRAAYEDAKRLLTAEQLQRFEIDEPMFPFEDVLEELEALHQQRKAKEAS